jgi:SpoVK/Ycf46/Vps4 family AAA+-type ATPase
LNWGASSLKRTGITGKSVCSATNGPWAIDPALRRPGRLKKLVFIPPPDLDARKSIFEIHLKKLPLEADVSAKYLAEITQGFSGALITYSMDKDGYRAGEEEQGGRYIQ